jgi:uncharacterized protein
MTNKVQVFFKSIYHKLVGINDSPHKIAGGFAVGVFLGILPAAGPVASIVVAWILRVNRAAAFVGGLLTNTWLSLVTFVFAIKIGSYITGADWQKVSEQCKEIFKTFNWRAFFDASIMDILKPMFVGYAVVALIAAVIAYVAAFQIVSKRRRRRALSSKSSSVLTK